MIFLPVVGPRLIAPHLLHAHNAGGAVCSSGIPGVESSDGLACCPSECSSCDTCGSRRLTYYGNNDSSSNDSSSECGGRRRLTVKGGESSRDLTENYCGVLRRRRLTYYGGGSDSSDSSDSGDYEDYCECGSSNNEYRRLRGLAGSSSDSGDSSCNCGAGRRLTYYGGDSSDSQDDCNCECECECECTPEVPEIPEPSCCADEIINNGKPCDVTGSAPCFYGRCFGHSPHVCFLVVIPHHVHSLNANNTPLPSNSAHLFGTLPKR